MELTVVIADDSFAPRNVLKAAVINDCGFTVVGEATNGQQAVDLCRALRPDLAILDVNMPVLDGNAAAEIIEREGLAKRIIMVTLARQALSGYRARGFGTLGKPFTDRALLAREIRRVADGIAAH